ncbi:MAG: hypothetical protein M0Z93_05170 [Actinomycetota bacterium]|nr:hypothetical protein [Actinomycetota bacterium]
MTERGTGSAASAGSGYEAMLAGCARVELARDVLEVSGPDAGTFLQGQCSQDVLAIPEGACADALLLAPDGRIDALVRVTHQPGPVYLVDVEGGYGEQVRQRLQRFLIRTAARVTPLPWASVGFRGPEAIEVGTVRAGGPGSDEPGAVVLPVHWGSMVGVDVLGPPAHVASFDPGAAVVVATPAEVEAVRIASGIPRMGAEITDRSIPAELGLVARTVSFTKGCYLGQELVARIDARGSNVPKRLVVLRIDTLAGGRAVASGTSGASSPPPPGAVIKTGTAGEERGVVTSSQPVPGTSSAVALGLLHRRVTTPAPVVVEWRDGEVVRSVPARATDLPDA